MFKYTRDQNYLKGILFLLNIILRKHTHMPPSVIVNI